MRIDSAAYVVDLSHPESAPETGAAGSAQGARNPGETSNFDRVEISSGSLNLEQLKQRLAALPDIRLDRVAVARQALESGGYQVSAGVLAEKMMDAFRP